MIIEHWSLKVLQKCDKLKLDYIFRISDENIFSNRLKCFQLRRHLIRITFFVSTFVDFVVNVKTEVQSCQVIDASL